MTDSQCNYSETTVTLNIGGFCCPVFSNEFLCWFFSFIALDPLADRFLKFIFLSAAVQVFFRWLQTIFCLSRKEHTSYFFIESILLTQLFLACRHQVCAMIFLPPRNAEQDTRAMQDLDDARAQYQQKIDSLVEAAKRQDDMIAKQVHFIAISLSPESYIVLAILVFSTLVDCGLLMKKIFPIPSSCSKQNIAHLLVSKQDMKPGQLSVRHHPGFFLEDIAFSAFIMPFLYFLYGIILPKNQRPFPPLSQLARIYRVPVPLPHKCQPPVIVTPFWESRTQRESQTHTAISRWGRYRTAQTALIR